VTRDPFLPERKSYIYVVTAVAAVGGFLFGFDLAIISGAMLYLKKVFGLDGMSEGFAMGSATLGCMAGPLLALALSDSVGRKRTLVLAAFLFAVSAAGTALSPTIAVFNTLRVLGGIGVGLSSVVSPMYIAEIAPASIRGRLVTINNLAIVGGSFAAILVSYVLSQTELRDSWRWMFGSQCIPAIAFMIGLAFAPNSPRWLAGKGREAEALEILTRVQGSAGAAVEMEGIRDSLSQDQGRFAELFRPGLRLALLIAVCLGIFQQATGSSVLFANAPLVFQKAGFMKESQAIGQSAILMVWNILSTMAGMWLVERCGRRPLLLGGLIGMGLGLASTGLVFQFDLSGSFVLVVMFVGIGMYVMSLAPLTWLLMSELFPTRLRGKAMSMAGMVLWVACYAGLQTFPPLRDWFERRHGSIAGVFYLYAGVCVLAFFFSLSLVPETKGKTLEEIERLWAVEG
jgi:sugar porter (SP) family MFS transporter